VHVAGLRRRALGRASATTTLSTSSHLRLSAEDRTQALLVDSRVAAIRQGV